MRSEIESVTDFGGIAKNIAPAKMPPQLFQEDVGGGPHPAGELETSEGYRPYYNQQKSWGHYLLVGL